MNGVDGFNTLLFQCNDTELLPPDKSPTAPAAQCTFLFCFAVDGAGEGVGFANNKIAS